MKKYFLTSLILNGAFLIFLAWFSLSRVDSKESKPASIVTHGNSANLNATEKSAQTLPTPEPFHWSQVESEDYTTYLSRLRAIGCPEKTIRQIVNGEVTEMLAEKRTQLQQQYGRSLLPAEARKLEQEHATVLASIMQSAPAPSSAPAANLAPESSPPLSSTASHIQYPLALRALTANNNPTNNPSHSTPGTLGSSLPDTPAQQQALAQIGQNFTKDLGGANQNPSDPQYLIRWSKAQQEADNRMRSLMGVGYFNAYGIKLAAKANEDAQK